MSLFGHMFDEPDANGCLPNGNIHAAFVRSNSCTRTADIGCKTNRQPPSSPRPGHGFCGISNQGATCYLNSLIQTLVMTPEFRRRLFMLGPNELGHFVNGDAATLSSKVKLRVIPVQLQRLFARLLLLDVAAVSTEELTTSFGWTNNEERTQHDVQELNRILFSAIEDSLIGTPGESLIRDLYHGTLVNTITCTVCGRTSERVEDFLDLCLSTAGTQSLEDALSRLFIEEETLNASNQYHCDTCACLTDAVKRTRVRRLPPILTVSILRFSFDLVKLERTKETGRFTFPHLINMSPYCENRRSEGTFQNGHQGVGSGEIIESSLPLVSKLEVHSKQSNSAGDFGDDGSLSSPAAYELFSVVVHRGGAHGGHYHVLIRDIDSIGTWSDSELNDTKIQVKKQPKKIQINSPSVVPRACTENVTTEAENVSSPESVVGACLARVGKGGMSVAMLCSEILKYTGVSWKKCFKQKNGSLMKFIRSHSDLFDFDEYSHFVSLRLGSSKPNSALEKDSVSLDHDQCSDSQSRIGCESSTVEEQCAPIDGPTATSFMPEVIPGHCWYDFNDSRVHPVRATDIEKQFCGKESAYMLFYRAVPPAKEMSIAVGSAAGVPDFLVEEVAIENARVLCERSDHEETANQITIRIYFGQSYEYSNSALHLRSGSLQYLEQSVDRRMTVAELLSIIGNVGGEMVSESDRVIHIAQEVPAGLHLYQEVTSDLQSTLSAFGIVESSKLFVWDGKQVDKMSFAVGRHCEPLLVGVEIQEATVLEITIGKHLTVGDLKELICNDVGGEKEHLKLYEKRSGQQLKSDDMSLKDAGLQLRSCVVATFSNNHVDNRLPKAVNTSNKLPGNGILHLQIESRLGKGDPTIFDVEVDAVASVNELKLIAFTAAAVPVDICEEETRLRIEDVGTLVLGPPLHESVNVVEAGLESGRQVVLERGCPPSETKIVVFVTVPSGADVELCVERDITGEELQNLAIATGRVAGGSEWHLCRADWAKEAGAVVPADQRVGDCNVCHGDHLLLLSGAPVPEGFVQLSVYLALPLQLENSSEDEITPAGVLSRLKPLQIENIVISKQSKLADLKKQISSLESLSSFETPSPLHIRLRNLLPPDLRPGSILRNHDETIQKLKVGAGSAVLVEILPLEEDLSPMQMPLFVQRRIPGHRSYSDCALTVLWDVSQGATLASLRRAVAGVVGEPDNTIRLAKHFQDKFEWLAINDVSGCDVLVQNGTTKKNKKGKKKNLKKKPANDLRLTPYFLQDCDVLGIKVLHEDGGTGDDFGTPFDDLGLEMLRQIKVEAQVKKKETKFLAEGTSSRRPETAIKIHVDNFQ